MYIKHEIHAGLMNVIISLVSYTSTLIDVYF
jgi:hypothetical protein